MNAVRRLLDLRRKRLTAVALSGSTGIPRSTIGRLKGIGHRITGDRRSRNCGIGWQFVHVAIDDHSRLAYVEVLPDELAVTTAGQVMSVVAAVSGGV